jgi:hypothetical protein
MQTFVPYPNLELCAISLDRARLEKQRIECKQSILRAVMSRSRVVRYI